MPQQIIKGRFVEALKTTASWAVDAGHDVHVPARSPQALRPRDGLTVTGSIQAGARRTAGISKYSRSIRRTLVLTLAAAVSLLAAAQHAEAASGPIAADGLSNPSSIAIRGSTVYVLSAAYLTHNHRRPGPAAATRAFPDTGS